MNVNYCDLCSCILKENNFYIFYISLPSETNFNELDYYYLLKKVQRETKEICPSCKHIFDKMFELRLHRLSELTQEINQIYELSPKKNPNEKEKK